MILPMVSVLRGHIAQRSRIWLAIKKNTCALRKLWGERCVLVLSSSYLACSCTRFIVRVHFVCSVPRVSDSVCSASRVSALRVIGSSCLYSASFPVSLSFAKYKGQPECGPRDMWSIVKTPSFKWNNEFYSSKFRGNTVKSVSCTHYRSLQFVTYYIVL